MSKDEHGLAHEGTALVQAATDIQVVDAPSFARAGEMLKAATLFLKRVAEVFDPICRAADAAHRTAVAQRTSVSQYAIDVQRTMKQRMGAYEQAQAVLARERAETAVREQQRLEAEERARVAAAEALLRSHAEEVRLAEAIVAEQAGDTVRAQALLEAPLVVMPVAATPVFVAPPPVDQPKVAGVSFRDDWDFTIVDDALIPREYLMPDLVKIRRVVRALKSAAAIPGVLVFATRTVAVRT